MLQIIYALLLILSVATQYAWPAWLHVGSCAPQLALVAVLCIGLLRGSMAGLLAGFFAAWLSASVGDQPMGTLFISYMGIGMLAGLLSGNIFSTRLTVAALSSFVASVIASLLLLIASSQNGAGSWWHITAMTALATAIWSIPAYWLFRALHARFTDELQSY